MDPLVEMPRARWPEIRDIFSRNSCVGVQGYYALDTHIQHPDLSNEFYFKVHCPYGVVENGVVLFDIKGDYREVMIFIINKKTKQLEEALVQTKTINWNLETCIPYADEELKCFLRKLYPKVGLKEVSTYKTSMYIRWKKECPYEYNQCPANTYIAQVRSENIQQVDESWSYHCDYSHKFFEALIANNLAYGLYSSIDHILLAWVFINDAGFLSHLYTEEAYRRVGYAECLVKYVVNDLKLQGKDVYCYIVNENDKSARLFEKLGFEKTDGWSWVFVVK